MTAAVEFLRVSRHFGPASAPVKAVDGVDLTIAEGSFFAMLGPSGSGKTTCLRLISGFEKPTGGTIRIFGQDVGDIPPNRRNVNTVFQDYALFPHMNVRDNVGYGLMVKGVDRRTRDTRAEEMLSLVKLEGYGDRKPAQLSGGQRQRVALARALVNEPKVLLLDEPLGALDLKLREAMQDELKALQARLGITFVFVTHDQGEALSMADSLAVFNEGKIAQIGTPAEVYARPRTRFVADFVGSSNVLPPDVTRAFGGHRHPLSWVRLAPQHRAERHRSGGPSARRSARAGPRHHRRPRLRPHRAACDGGRGMTSPTPAILPERGLADRLTALFWRRPRLLLAVLLTPPLLWLGVVYLGSLAALLLQSFYSIDEFSGVVKEEFTLKTYAELFRAQNLDIIIRTLVMSAAVTIGCAVIAFPIAYYAARFARGKWKAVFYLGVMLPLWSSYLVKVYAWKLILAKEGIITWAAEGVGLSMILNAILAIPGIGGNSLSTSPLGTFIVFVYVWLPYMILPMQASLERVPNSMLEASADLGASRAQTFRTVILPLAMPGVIAGSIFTFSLTMGDYIIPQIVGTSARFIGLAVYQLQGTAGNIPLAAAFAVVPIVIMLIYLMIAKRKGAFDAL